MRRIHLFEFEDLPWFPDLLRNFGTDFLRYLANNTKLYKPVVPLLEQLITECKTTHIIDLGSGGGGGWLSLVETLSENVSGLQVTLTDWYPNLEAFEYITSISDRITFLENPVDARNVPKSLQGIRTQFLSLHHFKPHDAKQMLQNAVEAKAPIAIFEAQERSVPSFLAMFFSPVTVILTTPFIRPFKWTRILFTYLIPVVPLFVWWDGMVSCLRTYSVSEMNELIGQVKNQEKYTWTTGKIKSGPGMLLYLMGRLK